MRRKLLSIVFLSLAGMLVHDLRLPAQDRPDPSKSDVVVERLLTQAILENDGRVTRHIEYKALLQTEAAVKQTTVIVFPYNNRFEELQIHYLRVVKPDGRKIDALLSAIDDMPSQTQREAGVYGDFREKSVPVPALATGDHVEYAYSTSSRTALVPGQFTMEHKFLTTSVVQDEELVIDLPAARALKIKWAEGIKPEIRNANGRREYRVTHTQGMAEDQQKANEAPPAVRLSTFQSWEEVGRWFADAMKNVVTDSPEIKAKAAELAPPNLAPRTRAEALYAFAAARVRTVGVAFGSRRIAPTVPAEVLKNGYGDMVDKCALLSSLMTAAGFPTSMLLVRTGSQFDPDVPSLDQFDYLVMKTSVEGNDFWLDPVSGVATFGHLHEGLRKKNSLEVAPAGSPRLLTTPAESTVASSADTRIRGELDSSGDLALKVVHDVRGDAEVVLRLAFRMTPQKDWSTLVQKIDELTGLTGDVSDLKVADPSDLQAPFRLEYSLSKSEFVSSPGVQKLAVPAPRIEIPPAFAPEQRAAPIPLTSSSISISVELTLPDGMKVQPPLGISLQREFAKYSSKYEVDGRTVKVRRTLTTAGQDLARERYVEYNGFLDTVKKDQEQAFSVSGIFPIMSWKLPGQPQPPVSSKQGALFQDALKAEQYGEVRKAERLFKEVLAKEPKNAAAWFELGQVYTMTRQRADAIAAWKKVVEIDPYQQAALWKLAIDTQRMGSYAETEAAFRKLLDITPLDALVRGNLGRILILQGKPAEAIPYLETAVTQNRQDIFNRSLLAEAYLKVGDAEKGVTTVRALVHDFSDPHVYRIAASTLADAGVELVLAQEYATDGLRIIYPLLQGGSDDPADRMQATAQQLVGFLWDSLGWVYFKRGDLVKASGYLKAAWSYTQNDEVGGHYGQLLVQEGKTAEAARVLANALAGNEGRVTPGSRAPRALLEKLVGPARAKQLIASGSENLQQMRTIHLGPHKGVNGSAEWNVIFEAGKKPRLKFLSGSHELDILKPEMEAANYTFQLPSDVNTPLAIKGIVSCSSYSGCMLVLTPPLGFMYPGVINVISR